MSSDVGSEKISIRAGEHGSEHSQVNEMNEKNSVEEQPEKRADTSDLNLVYDEEEEPELHARTYFALAAMFLLNLVQLVALQGPPASVRSLVSTNGAGKLTIATCSLHISERISMERPGRHGYLTRFHLCRR